MDKFNSFVETYEGTQFELLPKFMKRRVDALKKLQLEHIKIQHQYNKRLQELELEFEKLHKPLYEKRAQIINGTYEPTDEECQLPANLAENEFNGDQENAGEIAEKDKFTEAEENELKSKVKGLPGFWLGCLSSTYNISDSIEEHDRHVLKHLTDIQLLYDQTQDQLSYKLEFHFAENPYFSNKVLTKTYYLKSNPDEKNPFSYEGFEVFRSEGCEIMWKENKDITTKTITVKQKNKKNGQTREKKKQVEQDSFFYFFKPPQVPEGTSEEDLDDELGAVMAVDFELGELIRQSLIPKAALYYTGFMIEDEDDDDEDDDEDGEAFSCEDDDSDTSDDDEESDDSSDSLAKKDK